MKKMLVLLFGCAMIIIACGKKVMPESDANNQSDNGKEKTEKQALKNNDPAHLESPTSPNTDMERAALPAQNAPASANLVKGKTVYVTKCGSCHALKNPIDFTASQWNNILKNEIPKAKLDNKEAEQVKAYIMSNTK